MTLRRLLSTLAIVLLSGGYHPVLAAELSGVTLEPAYIHLSVRAGDTTTQPLIVVNHTGRTQQFQVVPLSAAEAGLAPVSTESPRRLSDVISYDPHWFQLADGQTATVQLRASPAAGTPAGPVRGVVAIEELVPATLLGSGESSPATNGQLAVLGSVGALVTIDVGAGAPGGVSQSLIKFGVNPARFPWELGLLAILSVAAGFFFGRLRRRR